MLQATCLMHPSSIKATTDTPTYLAFGPVNMLRTPRASSSFSQSSSAACSRSRCLGFIAPRTATLLLALLGVVAHLQTFRHLEVLYDSFPQVPNKPRVGLTATASRTSSDAAGTPTNAWPQDADRWSVADADNDTAVADAVAAATSTITTHATSTDAERLALVKPPRWFNLLPKRPWGSDPLQQQDATASELAIWRAQQAGQDKERKSWEAARRLTKVMRFYALLSAAACIAGVYGVLKSNLAATRIFVLSSFLDAFLFAFSIVSMCIIVTYPEIRAMLCEQISSGELHAMLNYMRGANNDNVTPHASPLTATPMQTGSPAVMAAISSSSASSATPTSFLSYAASSFWKRAMSTTQLGAGSDDGDASSHVYWWDTLIDNMLENESCDDIFVSVLVPLGLAACLIYLAFRIHFLFVIRTYYTSLLRDRMSYYLGGGDSNSTGTNTPTTTGKQHSTIGGPLEEKSRKYSSSSSSSSTAFELLQSGRVASPSSWLTVGDKILNEKMA